jgi:hypothetical protein
MLHESNVNVYCQENLILYKVKFCSALRTSWSKIDVSQHIVRNPQQFGLQIRNIGNVKSLTLIFKIISFTFIAFLSFYCCILS